MECQKGVFLECHAPLRMCTLMFVIMHAGAHFYVYMYVYMYD